MQIIIAKSAGFCFGVRRALELVEAALNAEEKSPIFSLGPLIHNPTVVKGLEAKGLHVVNQIEEVPEGRVVIRSHGVGPGIYQYAKEKNLEVIDATCPFVKNVHQLAVLLKKEGYQLIIIGEREHAEVKGVLDSAAGEALIVSSPTELEQMNLELKVGIISQTTQDINNFQQIVCQIVKRTKECRVFNTICLATSKRQQEVAELSKQVDLVIVVGGKNSANTCRLAEIAANNGTLTYHVESAAELQTDWFQDKKVVGITAGASTPDSQINAVVEKIKSLGGIISD
ncbi:MAG TPA: 4-hydroxy-3-methylbut-2-enyl diphosphate reductase [Bacillota bacterium]|nr:4-hydroxy-3-methylbut-2-enyl diphosphate reductase [Bacillota bacterium]HOL10319.1 4-hydroxy-3-methylbut-2-enyl diphosphate reductase [Bacillota bacterium]HPO98091.1 4-hydroxy-3-methylbut-2-enyl diphosphate reductase [Bacillota bacterium]